MLVLLAGCNPAAEDDGSGSSRIPIRLDRSGEDALIHYYFGSYLDPVSNPVAAGLVTNEDGAWYLNRPASVPQAMASMDSLYLSVGTGALTWDILSTFVRQTWYEARGLPRTTADLMESVGSFRDDPAWFRLDVSGSMSPWERRIHVPMDALLHALESGAEPEGLRYPVGTWFIADHYDQDRLVETTAMVKRADSLWDYAGYDASGRLVDRIRKHDGTMDVPTQCLGCHNGNRAFEPERSFPAEASPGPAGERRIYVGADFRDPVVASILSEHMKRADTILGVYATVFLSGIRSRAIRGEASPEERVLLEKYGVSP
ncbi:MAG: hypothetical protein RIE53_03210 [Rhodothermales bacterium]